MGSIHIEPKPPKTLDVKIKSQPPKCLNVQVIYVNKHELFHKPHRGHSMQNQSFDIKSSFTHLHCTPQRTGMSLTRLVKQDTTHCNHNVKVRTEWVQLFNCIIQASAFDILQHIKQLHTNNTVL